MVTLACNTFYNPKVKSIFYPETAETPLWLQPYNFWIYGNNYENLINNDDQKFEETQNVEAWFSYLKGKIHKSFIRSFLYPITENELGIKGLATDLQDQNIIKYIYSVSSIDSLMQYNKTNSWDVVDIDTSSLKKRILTLQKVFVNCQDPFLKERYFYQIIKGLFRIKKYQELIKFYEKSKKSIKNKTFIFEKAKCNYAGALYRTNQPNQAFYIFTQIFENSPNLRITVINSIRIFKIPLTKDALDFCKTKKERCNMLFLSCLNPKVNSSKAISQIYNIDPNFSFLQFLIGREINTLEFYYYDLKNPAMATLTDQLSNLSTKSNDLIKAKVYFTELDKLLKKVVNEKKIKNLDFYYLANAYTSILLHKYRHGKTLLNKIKNTTNDTMITKQKSILYIEHQLLSDVPYDIKNMDTVFQLMTKISRTNRFREEDILLNISRHLAMYFERKKSLENKLISKNLWQSRIFFAHLFGFNTKNNYVMDIHLKWYMGTQNLNKIFQYLTFAEHVEGNIDRQLLESIRIKTIDLKLTYVRRLILSGKFIEAKKYTSLIPDSLWAISPDNYCSPKLYLKNERHQILNDVHGYISRMAYLQNYLKSHPKDANGWLELGESWLNISYFGTAFNLSRKYRSTNDLDLQEQKYMPQELNKENRSHYFLLVGPKHCIEKAIKLSKDPDLQTKAHYLFLLCKKYEHFAKYYINLSREYEFISKYQKTHTPFLPITEYQYFENIKSNKNKSTFANQIIAECDTYTRFFDRIK